MARRRKPASGSVIPRGSVYQIRWRVNGGPAHYETIGPDRDEAEQALALRLAEISRGTYIERREATFHEYASRWFATKRAALKPSTVEDYRIALECHLLPFFGDYLLTQIGPELIKRYMAEKVAERKKGDELVAELEREFTERRAAGASLRAVERKLYMAKRERGLSNRIINKTRTRLAQVLEDAVEDRYIERNPASGTRHRLKVAKKAKPFLQLDQIDPLLDATPEAHRPLIETLLLAGLRIGEALALRWGDVDLLGDPPRVTVRRTLYGKHEGAVKTEEEGTVTFGPRLRDTLFDLKHGSRYHGDGELVFCTSAGRHLSASNVRQRILRPAVARANERLALEDRPLIPADLTPHRLRDTFCSLLIAQGEDVATVVAQMRHADMTTTLRVYTHVMKHRREGVAERLDQAIWGETGRKTGRKPVEVTLTADSALAAFGSAEPEE